MLCKKCRNHKTNSTVGLCHQCINLQETYTPHPKTIANECEHEYKVIINGQKAVIPQCLKCSKMGKRIDLVYTNGESIRQKTIRRQKRSDAQRRIGVYISPQFNT